MKKFIIITLILLLILTGGIIYLNKVVLPVRIKALVISTLKKQTGKDVTLKSLEFSIFKGLILQDLVISDTQNVILSTRQASCSVFIWPILKKQIIIPGITLKSPYIFLERKADGSFNLQDLFPAAVVPAKKSEFSVSVLKICVVSGNVAFQDDTLATKFKKEIKNIQFNLYLGLPASVKFNFKGEMPQNPTVFISASGQYKILTREFSGNLAVKNLSLAEFGAYYNNLNQLVSGSIDLEAQISFKDQLLQANINAKGENLVLEKDKLKAKLNSGVQAKVEYNLQTKKTAFDGFCNIWQADITGIDFLGEIKNLRGTFSFNQRSLVADSLKAQLLGVPFAIKLGIKDFKTPVLSINTNLDLSILPPIAKEKFNFNLINSASGQAALTIKAHPDALGVWGVDGEVGITGASLKLDKQDIPVEDIVSVIEFSQQGFNWKDTKFKYKGLDYQSSGTFSDFKAPNIKLKLFSQDLSLTSDFNLLGKKVKITQLNGKYLDSQFTVTGDVDNSDSANLQIDLSGKFNLELGNLSTILDKQYPAIKSIRPAGQLDAQFKLNGNPSRFKDCYLQAKLKSNNFSLYGFSTQSLSMDFLLDQKIVKIPNLRIAIYDGSIEGSGALNLDTTDFPYQLELKADGIKLEKLKMDTASKNKNISGTLLGELKLNGFSTDMGKLSGAGSFSVKEGRLWELNLFKGLGKILFTKDLGSIELSECDCAFLIKDKFFSTDKLQIKGNIANLTGPLKIGFDGSLEGALNVDILSDMVPVSGTLKDLTTAIIGQSGKFAVIKLSGTLAEPKYSFKTAVNNILKGLTDVLFGKQ
ncbi:MAG: AsmA family protein [Candidatus Omnitrophica bacterium]|nr:AsmA family protein [Candidatus Omnitrophota bacterium]